MRYLPRDLKRLPAHREDAREPSDAEGRPVRQAAQKRLPRVCDSDDDLVRRVGPRSPQRLRPDRAIGGDAELAWKECRTQLGQHACDLATRWAVARRHRATREGSVGSGQRTTKFVHLRTHRAMPLASKSPS